MAEEPEAEITRLLNQAAAGDARAGGEVFPLLYRELRKLAASARAGLRRKNAPALASSVSVARKSAVVVASRIAHDSS